MLHRNGFDQSFENLAGRCNLSNCNLLRAESHFVEQVFSNGQLLPLIYLRWENCPKSSLPPSLPSMNLRVLHIQGEQLKTLWQHESQVVMLFFVLFYRSVYFFLQNVKMVVLKCCLPIPQCQKAVEAQTHFNIVSKHCRHLCS